jgi:hypothetical protein
LDVGLRDRSRIRMSDLFGAGHIFGEKMALGFVHYKI